MYIATQRPIIATAVTMAMMTIMVPELDDPGFFVGRAVGAFVRVGAKVVGSDVVGNDVVGVEVGGCVMTTTCELHVASLSVDAFSSTEMVEAVTLPYSAAAAANCTMNIESLASSVVVMASVN